MPYDTGCKSYDHKGRQYHRIFFQIIAVVHRNNTITNNASANIKFVLVISIYFAGCFIIIHMVKNTPCYQDQ